MINRAVMRKIETVIFTRKRDKKEAQQNKIFLMPFRSGKIRKFSYFGPERWSQNLQYIEEKIL
jgi:hypothetical protein